MSIPNTIRGLPVTVIGKDAFYSGFVAPALSSVIIPDSVITIGTNAFGSCTNLASVSMGTNVSVISDNAFYNCAKLPAITIPKSVAFIGANVLSLCTKLTAITVDPLNPVYGSVDGILFNKLETTLLQCPQARAGGFTVPSGTTGISDGAFQFCGGLTGIVMPDSVVNIGNFTFQNCTNLASVVLGANLKSIGNSTFINCPSLSNITIPFGLLTIGDSAFEFCGSLTNFVMPDTVTNTGNLTLAYCTNLVRATISTNVTAIGNQLFWWDSNLRQVTIPNGVITIGNGAFGNGVGITSLIIPDSVMSIGSYAFNACPLISLTIGNSVTNIGSWAFFGCINLSTSVTIPKSVINIDQSGFSNDWRVPAFFFEGNAPTVGPDSFWNTHSAIGYYLPNTSGWSNMLDALPTVLWNPVAQTSDSNFGVENNKFGFNVTGTTNIPIMIEVCTNLANANWKPFQSCLLTNGSIYISDAQYLDLPNRYYRIRSP